MEVETRDASCAVCGTDAARAVGAGLDFEYETCTNEFRYVACEGCGHVYLDNCPVPDALSVIYPSSYGNYDAERGEALTFRVKSWLDARRVRSLAGSCDRVRRVLDVGCADGRLLDVCRAALPDALSFHGVEISEDAARGAIEKGYEVEIGSVEKVALPLGHFDLIFLQQVIEHVHDPAGVVTRIARSLAPGGLAVIDTPTTDCLDYRLFRRRYWGGYHIPRHFNLFSEQSLFALCRKAGLVRVSARYTPQPVHWVWTLHHVLKDHGLPSWTYGWLDIRNSLAIAAGTIIELAAGLLTRRMSNLQLVVRMPRK